MQSLIWRGVSLVFVDGKGKIIHWGGGKTKYWDVHKSIWNDKLMRLYLENAGFKNIHIEIIENVHLVANAKKVV